MKWNKNLTLQAITAVLLLGILFIRPSGLTNPTRTVSQFFLFLFIATGADLFSQFMHPGFGSKICKSISLLVAIILFAFTAYMAAAVGAIGIWNNVWTPKR